MASILALVAAFLFALAATLQQKGALNLSELSLRDPASLARFAVTHASQLPQLIRTGLRSARAMKTLTRFLKSYLETI